MAQMNRPEFDDLAAVLSTGEMTSVALMEGSFDRINDKCGEGARTFLSTYEDVALKQASKIDQLRRSGQRVGPYAGIPISIKASFDLEETPTTAGSLALSHCRAAARDAHVVSKLKSAGFIIVGKTNMSELALTVSGINGDFGTPLNPFDRSSRRIPGGSSSGAAVSIADDMAYAAIGSDTGGSIRIPAALCGVVGFKPSPGVISTEGLFPLSPTLDTVGVMASSAVNCRIVYDEMRQQNNDLRARPLRLATLPDSFHNYLSDEVANTFYSAIRKISDARLDLRVVNDPIFNAPSDLYSEGSIALYEAKLGMQNEIAEYYRDRRPDITARFDRAAEMTPEHYQFMMTERSRLLAEFQQKVSGDDIFLMPTCQIIAPLIEEFEVMKPGSNLGKALMKNSTVANFFDCCSITIPCHEDGCPPVGLLLTSKSGTDAQLLRAATEIQNILEVERS